MNSRIIKALTKKDLKLFFKNKFFAAITVLGLVIYVVLYFVMPKSVDDTMGLAIYSKLDLPRMSVYLENEDLKLVKAKSIEELKNLVASNEVVAGFVIPDDLYEKAAKNETINIKIYTAQDLEQAMKEAMDYIGEEMIYLEVGKGLNIESKNEVLGPDLAGKQIPPSKRIIPVFTFFLVITETLGLASLISDELESKTIYALCATPSNISDIFISKGITGLLTTLIPAILFIFITVGFKQFGAILPLLIFGSIFTISVGFLIGSFAKDFMSVIAWGALFFIILIIPAMNVMAPGSLTGWVKAIPSSYFVDSLHRIINFNEGLRDISKTLIILLGSSLIFFALSSYVLKRRLRWA